MHAELLRLIREDEFETLTREKECNDKEQKCLFGHNIGNGAC